MRITKKIANFILITFMFTIFINTTVTASDTNLTFDTLVIGESYQFKGNGVLYAPGDFTIDHQGKVYIHYVYEDKFFSFASAIQVYSPKGAYLYSIHLPHADYVLSTNKDNDYIYIASTAVNTILEFDQSGILTNIIHNNDRNSPFYNDEFYKEIRPYGKFYQKQTNQNFTIILRKSNNQEAVYFEKNIEKNFMEKLSRTMLILLCIFIFVILLDGIIYKIRNNGKITDAFLFSNIKKAIVKINTKCKESMYPPKQH